jgi:hypothetical protein
MGGGGLMQLVAYGMQDVYLTGNASITFFKSMYRRHTNFSCEAVEQTFSSNSKQFGNRLVAVISRNGDLLHRMWLEVELPAAPPSHIYNSKVGHSLIKSAEIEIGGQRIDRVYGRFCDLWHNLSCRAEKKAGYELMSGNHGSNIAGAPFEFGDASARKLYIPLQFWFSKGSAGAALPLISLQYHEVRVTIEMAEAKDLLLKVTTAPTAPALSVGGFYASDVAGTFEKISAAPTLTTGTFEMPSQPKLYSDFFYLDTEERRRFSQMSHEYLIEQLQFTGVEMSPSLSATEQPHQIRLNFNHPTKAIYWTAEPDYGVTTDVSPNPFYNGLADPMDMAGTKLLPDDNSPFSKIGLMLNGHDRFAERDGTYFSWVQPWQHHTAVPTESWAGMYSFCLSPEEHQPSGALNFSRIDNAQLKLKFKGSTVHTATTPKWSKRSVYVYAVNYNVLRILSGMGGLAFSN